MELWEQRRRVLLTKQPPLWDHTPFDIIVLDEFQDCTELIFWLTSCFVLANQGVAEGEAARLVVLGDERQSIYSFHDADSRYLTRAPELLSPITPYPWARTSLSQSFRLSHPQTRFINDVLLGGEPYIVGSKAGPKPIVVRCNPYDSRQLIPELVRLIEIYGAKNTAIIAPRIRNNRPLSRLVNALSKTGVRIDVPRSDEAAPDHKVTRDKLRVSTIHQFKGSERDLIILFGIDSSFFKYIGRDLPDDRCPNEIFVAGTRAAKQLMLIHDESKNLMPFVSMEALYNTSEIVNLTENQADIRPPDAPGRPLEFGLTLPRSTAVQDTARYIPDEVLDDIVNDHLAVRRHSLSLPDIDMETVVESGPGKRFYEAVGDLNGLVVAASCELEVAGTLKTLGIDNDAVINAMPPVESPQHAPWLCRRACEYEAKVSGYQPRNIQMKNHAFDWIKPTELAKARKRCSKELTHSATDFTFEVRVEEEFVVDGQTTQIQGQIDVVGVSSSSDNNDGGGNDDGDDDRKTARIIWEIKFVSQLSNLHVVQACVYAYLLASESGKMPRIILYNVRNGEKWEITPLNGREGLRRMIETILRHKYTAKGEMEDKEFSDMCAKTMREVQEICWL
ncbi:p-loop containing nucleoside triphosphate hydrolase [Fusarium albosuccineum]|uniref:p-loop containing nucleoside triphosphate hydrolase n=1 Tax=Fusarium albosuccineum TaxID=1237068 RepID=A0A8H4LLR0_9HYPO|nr:p-loop containing nucleoside triphosphate hydrolase [Fusarium albosuccineum]